MKAGWGVSTGFPLQDATTTVYIVSNQAGIYTGKIELVDVATDDEVIAEQDIAITVEDAVIVPPTIVVGEVSGTVTAQEALFASDANGKITAESFSTEGLPSIDVSVKKEH